MLLELSMFCGCNVTSDVFMLFLFFYSDQKNLFLILKTHKYNEQFAGHFCFYQYTFKEYFLLITPAEE